MVPHWVRLVVLSVLTVVGVVTLAWLSQQPDPSAGGLRPQIEGFTTAVALGLFDALGLVVRRRLRASMPPAESSPGYRPPARGRTDDTRRTRRP